MTNRLRTLGRWAAIPLALSSLALVFACGGSGDGGGSETAPPSASSRIVSGTAAAGAPLAGMVNLKDSSSPPREKATVIAGDGSYAVDVSDLTAPFVLKASGRAGGRDHVLHSFARDAGTAHVNPFSNAAMAAAAGVDDPGTVYDLPDAATLGRIESDLPTATANLRNTFLPLLDRFECSDEDPFEGHVRADHRGLDDLFDHVTVTLVDGDLKLADTMTGATIYSGRATDVEHGDFSQNQDDLPYGFSTPAAPTGVAATGGDTEVTISWDGVCSATSYNLYWSTTPGVTPANGTQIADVTSPYVHTGLAADTTYYYVITAANGAGEGPASMEVSATTTGGQPPPPTVPAAPTGVSATGGTNQVSVFWGAVAGATSYNLYWSISPDVTPATGTQVAGVTSPAVLTGLTENTTYYAVVTAVNSAGESAPSVQVAATTLPPTPPPTAPAAPTGVTAAGGANQVTVSWSASADATSYNLYWSTTPGVTTATGALLAGVTSPYVHTGLSAGTTYYYVVTAVNAAGESAPSAEVSATTNPPAPTLPPAPTGATATGGANQVTVSWSAVAGATSYNLYWSTATGVTPATGTRIGAATSPYVHTGLVAGTTYYYVVTAVNAAGEGPPSTQVSATTNAPPPVLPGAPTGVTATGGANQVTVSWSAVAGATSYNLYRSTTAGVTPSNGTQIAGVTSPYADTGLSAGTTYYYVVTAVNAAGEGPASAQASATTNPSAPTLPAAPTGVTATGGAGQVTVSWSAVTGATSYNLYWSTTAGVTPANGTQIAGVTSPYVHTGLTAGTTYYYVVTAVNAAGEGPASAQTSAAPGLDGAALYGTHCAACHGPLATSSKRGRTAAQIQAAIDANVGGMGSLSTLSPAEVAAIAAALM